MRVIETPLPGVVVIEPDVYMDHRGSFAETYQQERYLRAGIGGTFVQDNCVHSRHGVLRGLHYQLRKAQGKLVYPATGEIFDVAVDIRKGSPTFGRWFGTKLSWEKRSQIYVPGGFAHGYFVLSETADVVYKCTEFYDPDDEYGIAWDDPDIGIDWPDRSPILSEKDGRNPFLAQIPEDSLPVYEGQ